MLSDVCKVSGSWGNSGQAIAVVAATVQNDDLMHIARDPDLGDPRAASALIQLAQSAARGDEDIAGDVLLVLTEKLLPGGVLRERLGTHANPPALLVKTASNAARDAWDTAGRFKRTIPLTGDGELTGVEAAATPFSPTYGLFDLLGELGWSTEHLEMLALPRRRAGRSVHPGIEDGLEKLAACFGVTVRCPGCPTELDQLRVDLRGPASWPHLVPVLAEWGWSPDVIQYVTTSPANIAHWRALDLAPPARQERRMVEIVRKMRVEPWLLQDSQAVRDSARTARSRAPRVELAAPSGSGECRRAS